MSEKKNIVVAVTGGIAAYKACELTSRLKKAGYEVRCIMTEHAQAFLTPLTLETLSGAPVVSDLFVRSTQWNVEHIALAKWADVFVIAPATANVIGKIASGIADDFLTTCVMATEAPVVVVPAMNTHMYDNPINQRNMATLAELGYLFVEPVVGNLACGDEGKGKMAEPCDIVRFIDSLNKQDLEGLRLLVTAGPTREAIDPVRYLTNHSSGKMGYAIAEQAAKRGALVTLVSGPVSLPTPPGVRRIDVQTAIEMREAVLAGFEQSDAVVKAAAVADYRPSEISEQKIKKGEGDWQLTLVRNPDILAELGQRKQQQILVGFAAETNDVEQNALKKLSRKQLDMIVANDLTEAGSGFGVDTNKVTIYHADGDVQRLPVMSKKAVADALLDEIKTIWQNQRQHQDKE